MSEKYDIYDSAKNDNWRFVLGKSGEKILFTIGLNPSTATKEASDTTVAKVEKVAVKNGFDGFVMLNLYPLRSTDYNALPIEVDQLAFDQNLNCIVELLSSQHHPFVWVAWGNSISARKYFPNAISELYKRCKSLNICWQHFGQLTALGNPRHPSRLFYEWKFNDFNLKHYLR